MESHDGGEESLEANGKGSGMRSANGGGANDGGESESERESESGNGTRTETGRDRGIVNGWESECKNADGHESESESVYGSDCRSG